MQMVQGKITDLGTGGKFGEVNERDVGKLFKSHAAPMTTEDLAEVD